MISLGVQRSPAVDEEGLTAEGSVGRMAVRAIGRLRRARPSDPNSITYRSRASTARAPGSDRLTTAGDHHCRQTHQRQARPWTTVLLSTVIEVSAKIVPTKNEPLPRVAELPICQNTLHSEAPLVREIVLPVLVISVESVWKMNTASELPCPSRTSWPDSASGALAVEEVRSEVRRRSHDRRGPRRTTARSRTASHVCAAPARPPTVRDRRPAFPPSSCSPRRDWTMQRSDRVAVLYGST